MRCFSIYLAASLVLASAIAQDKPNFSGRWLLDTQKSDFGGAPEPLMQVLSLTTRNRHSKSRKQSRATPYPVARRPMKGSIQPMEKKPRT